MKTTLQTLVILGGYKDILPSQQLRIDTSFIEAIVYCNSTLWLLNILLVEILKNEYPLALNLQFHWKALACAKVYINFPECLGFYIFPRLICCKKDLFFKCFSLFFVTFNLFIFLDSFVPGQ